ncbi:hypothetical protein FRB99_005123 [Tulasnella sp. 403]|nr:hypothetical protein FRB99_005123 [Tulasnella sp. 403]
MSTIDLPPEIMYIIFELVYAQSPQVKIHDWDYWPWQPNPYEKIPKIKEHPLLDVMLVSTKGISRLSFPGMAMSISAPNLTTISLPWFSSQFLVLSDSLPPQVAVLKLPSRMTHLPNVMPNPAALRSLCVMIERSADCFEDLDLPHLSHLRVAFWDSPMTPWLDYLRSIDRFPNLESLSIIMPNRYTHIPLPSLPNIHFLEWVEGPLGIAASFRAILAACPNLLHLACIPLGTMYDDVTNTNLSVVTERIATGPFELLEQVTQTGELEYCPHLRTLCVEGYRVELDGPLAVRPMLRLGGWNRHSWMGKSDVSERGLPAAAGL